MDDSVTLDVPVFSSLLVTSLLYRISAQYKWHQHGFLPPWEMSHVEVELPLCHICQKVSLSCTEQWWDTWIRTFAYVEQLFDSFLPFPSLVQVDKAQWVCT